MRPHIISIAALSQTLPDRLIEQATPLSAMSRWNCSLGTSGEEIDDDGPPVLRNETELHVDSFAK